MDDVAACVWTPVKDLPRSSIVFQEIRTALRFCFTFMWEGSVEYNGVEMTAWSKLRREIRDAIVRAHTHAYRQHA